MQIDSSSIVNEKFDLKASFGIFKEWTSWLILAIEICLGVPLQSVQLFLPQIVSRLGYGAVKTNLYTVAPNIGGAVMLLLLAFDLGEPRLEQIAAWVCGLFTILSATAYAGVLLRSIRAPMPES